MLQNRCFTTFTLQINVRGYFTLYLIPYLFIEMLWSHTMTHTEKQYVFKRFCHFMPHYRGSQKIFSMFKNGVYIIAACKALESVVFLNFIHHKTETNWLALALYVAMIRFSHRNFTLSNLKILWCHRWWYYTSSKFFWVLIFILIRPTCMICFQNFIRHSNKNIL